MLENQYDSKENVKRVGATPYNHVYEIKMVGTENGSIDMMKRISKL